MLRQRFALAITFSLLAAATARAGGGGWNSGGGDWWHNYWTDWHRNNCWMEPFVCPDRASVGNMFQAEIGKGWQLQCLLGEPHFFELDNSGNYSLSPAGLNKIKTILMHNPPQYRTVYIERSLNDEITAKRLAAAQRAVAELSRGAAPEVLVSDIPLIGTPADQVNGVNTWLIGLQKSYPAPQTKAFKDEASSSGSSGSP